MFVSGPSLVDDRGVNVYLDGQPLSGCGLTLGAALAVGAASARAGGRIVVEVHADGALVPDEHLADPPPDAPYAGELDFVTAEPRALVSYTLNDAAEALGVARERQSHAAAMLRTGQMQHAMEALTESLSVWEMVRRAVHDGCSLIGMPIEQALASGAGEGAPLADGLSANLSEVKRAIASEDWSSLADTLAYELDDEARRWTTALTELAASMSPPSDDSPS